MTIVPKSPWEESVRKVSLLPIEICSASYIVSNWYLLGVEVNLGHAHKTRFWYLLGVFSKFSAEQPRHFYGQYSPASSHPTSSVFFCLFILWVGEKKQTIGRLCWWQGGIFQSRGGGGEYSWELLERVWRPVPPNPNPILDQKMSFSTWHLFSDQTFKVHTRFPTWPLRRNYVINT